jgi:hypothetical protein
MLTTRGRRVGVYGGLGRTNCFPIGFLAFLYYLTLPFYKDKASNLRALEKRNDNQLLPLVFYQI